MKKILAIIFVVIYSCIIAHADVTLGNRCEAFRPIQLLNDVIYKYDADAIANSIDFGQTQKPTKLLYWIVYSDDRS